MQYATSFQRITAYPGAYAWEACLQVLAERPRRRKLQQLPPEAIVVLYRYDVSSQEDMPITA
jgi:hypothetical protein